jgi:nitric oxide reductase NorQ protein
MTSTTPSPPAPTTHSLAPPPTSTSASAPPTAAPAAPPGGKARPGELRAQVAWLLTLDPGNPPRSVTDIAKTLGHSGGAVGNACQTLVARGEAEQVGAKPRTYRATASTAAAAQKAVITPPGQGRPAPPRPAHPAPPPAGTASPALGANGRPVPITRPNGQSYHPRSLANLPDVEALRRLRAASVPVLLYGPPGTGKTSLLEAAFPDLLTVAGDGDTTTGDLIGEYTQDEHGGYEFIYGPLVIAMQEGRALLLDDATLISPKVLAALYPAMDGRRQIIVKAHKGETITAADGFYIVAGHNPGVHGAILTEALASRFSVQIQVGTDYDLAQTLKINSMAVRVARNLATRQASGEIGWAPQLRELIAFQKIADALGAETAFANLVGIAPPEDRDTVAEIVTKLLGKPVTALTLGRQL